MTGGSMVVADLLWTTGTHVVDVWMLPFASVTRIGEGDDAIATAMTGSHMVDVTMFALLSVTVIKEGDDAAGRAGIQVVDVNKLPRLSVTVTGEGIDLGGLIHEVDTTILPPESVTVTIVNEEAAELVAVARSRS
ncbi:hypothetical protein HDU80_005108 [Chytriomyces hyalinus]|nr:hypothetical protein HDU80_005108 [Chytriomyces hyalinus]